MTPQMLSTLDQIERRLGVSRGIAEEREYDSDSHYMGQAAVGDAVNIPDTLDRFAVYIQSIVDSLCAQYGCGDEEAMDCISQAADELAQAGVLPPVPDRSDLKGIAAWQGKAVTAQLGGYACKVCYDKKGGSVAPDGRNLAMGG